jgi:hypothetical protein
MAGQTFAKWDDIPLLLTTDETAALLRVHVNMVKYLLRSGKLVGIPMKRAETLGLSGDAPEEKEW